MIRRNAFRTDIFRRALPSLDAEDQAVMTASLDEIDQDDLKHEALSEVEDAPVRQWDVCAVSIFNEGVYIKHWTRPLDGERIAFLDMHATTRRLSGGLPTREEAVVTAECVRRIADRSAIGTIVFLASGEATDGRREETLWWHPSLTKAQALMALDSWVHYAFEQDGPT